ncbi:MAG: TIGR00730 family Rossman fold protein, partial [Candidatus Aminicenantes bacterium]|nr:TIGR00730 family Rossman fold protein [Candidatus Aminicenantes bacterium]
MKRICVFCGSSPGARPEYAGAARQLGALLAQRKIGLVFGGGRVGLMGQLARAALKNHGEVIGVIPWGLHERKVAFSGLSDLRVVDSMHERKALMAELADGFMALPGGLGTLEELFEILTWGQLGMHRKPCGLLNVGGYYSPLLAFIDQVVDEGFLDAAHRSMILTAEYPQELLRQFETYRPANADKAEWALG